MQPMPLYKIIKMWFLPPGIFVVLLVLMALYTGYKARVIRRKCNADVEQGVKSAVNALRVACGGCLLMAILLYGLSINAIAQRFMHSLEYRYNRVETKVEAIVMISGDFEWEREKAAAQLYKKHKVPVVLSGYDLGNVESRMQRLGVPKEVIKIDKKAYNTKENVVYSLPLVKQLGAKKVYLVSSAAHMPRSMMNFEPVFKKQGINIVPYPAGYATPKEHRVQELEWVPDVKYLNSANRAWHEYVGLMGLFLN